jgi:shikimate kinase
VSGYCDGRHIVLVGMMGVGKSSVGRLIARKLDRPLLDSDKLVEERAGRSVREIWEADGEQCFRALEAETLEATLAGEEPSIVAAAGGVVLAEGNRATLMSSDAHVVWLLASLDVLLERVKNGVHRPLLDNDPEAMLRTMFEEREALYREVADAVVSVDNRSIHDVANAVLRCAS